MDVPAELAARRQWVCWKLIQRGDGPPTKVPFQPSGKPAKSNDPATWSSLAECQAAENMTGVGYVFAADDPFCGIDLDKVFHDGEISPWASEVLDQFDGTYCEFSPSGTGIKIWFRGQIPGGIGKGKKIVQGDESIECYDRGRYFTFTGQSLDPDQNTIADCQQALDAILAKFWPKSEPAPVVPAAGHPTGDIPARAAAYVDRIEGVTSGQNRGTRTMSVAGILVRGFELSPADALPILARWNSKCSPNNWPQEKLEKELLRKLRDADKHPGERGWLLNGGRFSGPEADLSALLANMEGGGKAVAAVDPSEPAKNEDIRESDEVAGIPDELLHPVGLLSEIVDFTLETSKYPQPEIALAGAVALLAVLTGRKVCDEIDTRTNVYVLTVNPARSGKDRPREVNKEILYLANGQDMVGPERIGSHAGLISWVDKSPAILFQIDELGRLLATTKNASKSPHLYSIPTVLMSLYSSATNVWIADAYADTKKTKAVDQPHCVVLGTTTAETLWPNLSTENVEDGLMGRLLVFEGRGYVDFHEGVKKLPVPSGIVQAAQWWVQFKPGGNGNLGDFHPIPQVVKHEPEAWEMFMAHVRDINQRRKHENAFRAAVWSGTAEKTAKLALIHACSRARGTPSYITVQDVTWAKHLANWLTRKMLLKCSEEVSENEVEAKSKRILKIVGAKRISRNELIRKLQWIRPRERREVLDDMVQCGLLTEEIESTGGRPKTWYRRP
jgi:hypothetical protein